MTQTETSLKLISESAMESSTELDSAQTSVTSLAFNQGFELENQDFQGRIQSILQQNELTPETFTELVIHNVFLCNRTT